MLPIAIDEIIQLLTPIVLAWAKYVSQNKGDPQAQLKILLDTADATVDAAEVAKFGTAPTETPPTKPTGT